jgi:hypothetical protein
MTDAQAQEIALNILSELDLLVQHGKLQGKVIEMPYSRLLQRRLLTNFLPSPSCAPSAQQTHDIRSHLEILARPHPPPVVGRKPPTIPQKPALRQCKALWSYAGAEADELTFEENDRVEVLEEVDAAWWRGCVVHPDANRSQPGLFPSNYVEEIRGVAPISTSPPPPARNMPPIFNPSLHTEQASSYNDEKQQMQGFHGKSMPTPTPYYNNNQNQGSLGPPAWQPGVARWSSGKPPTMPPAPPSHNGYVSPAPSSHGPPSPAPSNHAYYQQVANQAPADQQPLYGTQQPVVQTMEEKRKHDKVRTKRMTRWESLKHLSPLKHLHVTLTIS